jgi:hypothetical protein
MTFIGTTVMDQRGWFSRLLSTIGWFDQEYTDAGAPATPFTCIPRVFVRSPVRLTYRSPVYCPHSTIV